MLRIILALIFLLPILSSCSVISATQIGEAAIIGYSKQQFVKGSDGIPLYPYFKEIVDKTVIFDSPDGKIIKVNYTATGVNINKLENFYYETLPQLGWERLNTRNYQRDNEELSFSIYQSNRNQFLNFKITLSN